MKLYHVKQNSNNDYDTFDSAVVCAKNEIEAASLHPQIGDGVKISDVKVECIGTADEKFTESGVILSSFNAG